MKGCVRYIYMEKLHITGGRHLNGTIQISGMKNAALPILFACALNDETCVLQNVPPVQDVKTTLDILTAMGVSVNYRTPTTLEINGAGFRPGSSPDELVRIIRASSYLMGVELARCGRTRIGQPGGCDFGGSRPLDYHTRAFEYMGAEMTTRDGFVGVAHDGLHPAKIMLDGASVGATINIMLAASLIPHAEGDPETVIVNAAREPHVVDLALFLNKCGTNIRGAGTSEIHICGTRALHGCTYTIIPDMIEAGTYMAAVAGTGGCVTLKGVISKHLDSVMLKLTEMGVSVEDDVEHGTVTIRSDGVFKPVQIQADVYPGFPTDMHPQFAVLLTAAEGVSKVTEKVWPRRFAYLDELSKMGARFVHGDLSPDVTFLGSQKLSGAAVRATDLRAGAALVIAALMADGETDIFCPENIERGYDDLIGKLRSLGADITRQEVFSHGTHPAAVAMW